MKLRLPTTTVSRAFALVVIANLLLAAWFLLPVKSWFRALLAW